MRSEMVWILPHPARISGTVRGGSVLVTNGLVAPLVGMTMWDSTTGVAAVGPRWSMSRMVAS